MRERIHKSTNGHKARKLQTNTKIVPLKPLCKWICYRIQMQFLNVLLTPKKFYEKKQRTYRFI